MIYFFIGVMLFLFLFILVLTSDDGSIDEDEILEDWKNDNH